MDYAKLATFSRQATIEASTQNWLEVILFFHYNFVEDLIFLDMSALELQPAQRISECLLTD